jgi:hypothetical protein
MTSEDHLAKAEAYARTLEIERDRNTIRLAADQGEAMRCLIYHCTAAIVGAIVDHKNATKR